GDARALARSRELLRQAVDFELDAAACHGLPLDGRLLVLSSGANGRLVAHLLENGRLEVCFEADGEAAAIAQTTSCRARPARAAADDDDERSIVFRWLCGFGPE